MLETEFTVGVGTAVPGAVGHAGEKGQGCHEQFTELSYLGGLWRGWFPAAQSGLIRWGACGISGVKLG